MSEADACAALSQFRLIDPAGLCTVQQAVAGAQCWRLSSATGSVVYAVKDHPAVAWVSAAAGATRYSMAAAVFSVIERQARARGLRYVQFQTARRGLVRRAEACGYVLRSYVGSGCVMEKSLVDDE